MNNKLDLTVPVMEAKMQEIREQNDKYVMIPSQIEEVMNTLQKT